MLRRKTWRKARRVAAALIVFFTVLIFAVFQLISHKSSSIGFRESSIFTFRPTEVTRISSSFRRSESDDKKLSRTETTTELTCKQLEALLKNALSTAYSEIRYSVRYKTRKRIRKTLKPDCQDTETRKLSLRSPNKKQCFCLFLIFEVFFLNENCMQKI